MRPVSPAAKARAQRANRRLELLELCFFDFDGDLHNEEIEVALIRFLRPEMKFDTLDALQDQMARDCRKAGGLLA